MSVGIKKPFAKPVLILLCNRQTYNNLKKNHYSEATLTAGSPIVGTAYFHFGLYGTVTNALAYSHRRHIS